jgi:beta-barrel assembly-enhancing protease
MKRVARTFSFLLALFAVIVLPGCSKNDSSINIFSVNDDIALGQQADQQIRSDPNAYPVLDSAQNPEAYQHLYRVRNAILASGKLTYADRFAWRCTIIVNDTVQNAFCLPGGYMYVYTGIIKLLDDEAQFAGVMGHEMAHADRRHSTDQLTVNYGIDLLLGIITGSNTGQLVQIVADLAAGLGTLAFSRLDENEADKYAVQYLYVTDYDAASLGGFFTKVESEPQPPVFLSTHPSPENRLQNIQDEFTSLGGVHGQTFPDRYAQFKALLP